MKIEWNENPLKTGVFLDDQEKEMVRLRIAIEELEHELYHVYFCLRDNEKGNPKRSNEEALRSLEHWVKQEDDGIFTRVDGLVEMCIEELEHGVHIGDCTCFACSCSKCYAERKAGIDTIEGLSKYSANEIESAFEGENVTISEALNRLQEPYTSKHSRFQAWWKGYMKGWNAQRNKQLNGLKNTRMNIFRKVINQKSPPTSRSDKYTMHITM